MAFRPSLASGLRLRTALASSAVAASHRHSVVYFRVYASSLCIHRKDEHIRPFATAVPPPPSAPLPPPPHPVPPATPTAPASPPASESVLDDTLHETQRLVDLSSPSSPPPSSSDVIYAAPFLTALRRVKMFSLTSCVLSLLSSPIYLLLSPPTIPLSGRLAITTAVISFSLGTTLALTKLTQPYITQAHLHPPPPSTTTSTASSSSPEPVLTLETLNVLARPRYQRVRAGELRPLYNRLLSNVRAVGVGKAGADVDFYLHPDAVQHPVLDPLAQRLLEHEREQQGQAGAAAESDKGGGQGKAE